MDSSLSSTTGIGQAQSLGMAAVTDLSSSGSYLSVAAKALTTFSLLLLFLPVVMYFFAKTLVFEGLFLLPTRQSYIYSAIVAVVTVHAILAGFLLFASYEGGRTIYESYKKN